jgi:hypothetical protein
MQVGCESTYGFVISHHGKNIFFVSMPALFPVIFVPEWKCVISFEEPRRAIDQVIKLVFV